MVGKTAQYEARVLNYLKATTPPAPPAAYYLGLFKGDPGDGSATAAPALAQEVALTGTGYARYQITTPSTFFGALAAKSGSATGQQLANAGSFSFATPGATAWGDLAFFALCDAGLTTMSATLAAAATALSVASAAQFPASGNYYIIVRDTTSGNEEIMLVTAGQGTTSWTVTRGQLGTSAIGTTIASGSVVSGLLLYTGPVSTNTTLGGAITSGATSLTVASATGFPSSGSYNIVIDQEELTVTAGAGTTTWTVTRGINGTTAAAHSAGAVVAAVKTVNANDPAPQVSAGSFVISED